MRQPPNSSVLAAKAAEREATRFLPVPGPNPILRRGPAAGSWDELLIEARKVFKDNETYQLGLIGLSVRSGGGSDTPSITRSSMHGRRQSPPSTSLPLPPRLQLVWAAGVRRCHLLAGRRGVVAGASCSRRPDRLGFSMGLGAAITGVATGAVPQDGESFRPSARALFFRSPLLAVSAGS